MSIKDMQDPVARAVLSQVDMRPDQFHVFARNLLHAQTMGINVTPEIALQIARTVTGNSDAPESGDTRASWPPSDVLYDDRVRRDTTHKPVVYYVQFADRIKIGTSRNLRKRLEALACDRLLALEHGNATLERQRHAQFTALRITGEWFEHRPPLTTFIESLPPIDGNLQKLVTR